MVCLDRKGRRMDEEGRRYRRWRQPPGHAVAHSDERGMQPRKAYSALGS